MLRATQLVIFTSDAKENLCVTDYEKNWDEEKKRKEQQTLRDSLRSLSCSSSCAAATHKTFWSHTQLSMLHFSRATVGEMQKTFSLLEHKHLCWGRERKFKIWILIRLIFHIDFDRWLMNYSWLIKVGFNLETYLLFFEIHSQEILKT